MGVMADSRAISSDTASLPAIERRPVTPPSDVIPPAAATDAKAVEPKVDEEPGTSRLGLGLGAIAVFLIVAAIVTLLVLGPIGTWMGRSGPSPRAS